MRKLIVTVLSSLDGFAAGEGGDVFVMPVDLGFDRYNAERLRAADTMVLGATSFRQAVGYWPPLAEDTDAPDVEREISRLNGAIDKVVVSDTVTPDDTGAWADTTEIVRRADARGRIAELRQADGGDLLVFGSMTLWHDLLGHGLVDELHVLVGPGVVGSGVATFPGTVDASLTLLDARQVEDSQLVALRYAVGERYAVG